MLVLVLVLLLLLLLLLVNINIRIRVSGPAQLGLVWLRHAMLVGVQLIPIHVFQGPAWNRHVPGARP